MKMNRIQALAAAFLILTVAMPALAQDETATAGGEGEKSVNPVVLMTTSMGDLKISLYADKAPITVENFLSYVDDKFYDGTIFHRVIENFVIQGGGRTSDLVLKEKDKKDPIKNEADNGVSNLKGTISMARLPEPHSATTQFFINVNDNSSSLDHFDNGARFGYCVFGEVIEGMDVVDKMRMVQTGSKDPLTRDVPVETIEILSVTRVETE